MIHQTKRKKYNRVIISRYSGRGQMQTSSIKRVQGQITSFFQPAPEPILQLFVPLNKDAFDIDNEGKGRSNIWGKAPWQSIGM